MILNYVMVGGYEVGCDVVEVKVLAESQLFWLGDP